MNRLFLLGLIALLLGVGAVALVKTDPGYLLIAYGGYTVESSVWVGLLLIAAVVIALYTAVRFLHGLLASPGSMAFWVSSRKRRQSARLTNRGVMSFVEGNWEKSIRQLQRGARHSEYPVLNHLLAARASFQLEKTPQVRAELEQALLADIDAATAVDITQAELQVQGGQFERALNTLDRIAGNRALGPQVLRLKCQALVGLEDWEGLLALLPALKKQAVLPEAELARLEREIHLRLLEVAAADLGEQRATALQVAWKRVPAALQADAEILQCYLAQLAAAGAGGEAVKLITRVLKKQWDPQLVRLYGCIEGENTQRQLSAAKGWLNQHDDDAQLLLCLGRLAARERQWAQAREYYERSISAEPCEEACAELGRLLTASGEYTLASKYFCAGLDFKDDGLPELPLPDPEEIVPEERRISREDEAAESGG